LRHPSEKINMNAISRKLSVSVGQVHKYVSILRKEKLVIADRLKDSPITRALRVLWNLDEIESTGLTGIITKELPNAKGIGIYGSWASGANMEDADIDVWIKLGKEPSDLKVAGVRKKLERALGVPVDIAIITPERLEHFMEKSDSFYFSLYHGIILWGEGI